MRAAINWINSKEPQLSSVHHSECTDFSRINFTILDLTIDSLNMKMFLNVRNSMKYIKEEISELDIEKIKMDLSKATRLHEIASMNVKYLTGEYWAIDRKENSYLCKAQVLSRESATSTVYFFFHENTPYELLVTGMFGKFSVQVNAEEPSLKWQDSYLQKSFVSALSELGLPFQAAADVFAEELGIKFDNATTIFEFSKKVGV